MSDTPKTCEIVANAVTARVIGLDRAAKALVSDKLSYLVAGSDRSAAFKSKSWDGRSSFFDYRTCTFPAGFAIEVFRHLSLRGWKVSLSRPSPPSPEGPVDFENFDGWGGDSRYDYQPEVTHRLLRHGRFIAQLATGAGKTRCAALAIKRINRPTMFLTTRAVLLHQMKDALEKVGIIPGIIGDGIMAPRKGVTLCMVQTLKARLDDPRIKKLLAYFEFVIGEEAHEAGGEGYFDILNECPNAHYRLALTATPFMRDDEEANMRLTAAFGPIGIKVSEDMLIKRGVLAQPIFKIIPLDPPQFLRRTTSWPGCYDVGVVENVNRNAQIIQEALSGRDHGLTAMVLISRKRHGETLLGAMKAVGLRARFVFGETDQATRRGALNALGDGTLDVLIGSTILDVGVDVPAVGMIILAGGGKAEVGFRQRIGRGLRAKKVGPNICHVIDFEDNGNKILRTHAMMRREILVNTPGFAENILEPGADFDWRAFDAHRAALGVAASV